METPLVDLLFLSEKRKNALLLLMEGPENIETIKKKLKANSTSIQPQLKKLREQHLVTQENDLYVLTDIGKIVVEKMKPLLETLSVLEENEEYWADREMEAIPPFLLRRINELGHCTAMEPEIDHMFELIPAFVENVEKAKRTRALLSYFHPLFPSFYLGLAEKGVHVSLILPQTILKRWAVDYRKETEKFLKLGNTEILVFEDERKVPSVVATDNFMTIALFPKKAVFDRKCLISFEDSARSWGKDFLDHFEALSEKVTDVENYPEQPEEKEA